MGSASLSIRVTGIGETGPVQADLRSIPEMVLESVEQALADGGVTYADIDAVVTASVDMFDGLTASNIAVTEVVGAVMKPETRITADGLGALIHGACQLAAGAYKRVLIVAHCKPSMADFQTLTQWVMDPIHLQPLKVDFLTCAALQAQVLAEQFPDSGAKWAAIVAERRNSAAKTGLLPACSQAQVLASPFIAAPIRAEMAAPLGDGAGAIVLEALPGESPADAVELVGMGHDMEAHGLGERDLSQWQGLKRACRRAYAMAGIQNPAVAFDLAEPSCLYPHEEALFVEATGLQETTEISPGGGLFAGVVPVVAGLSRLIAAVRCMRTETDCRRALVHGAWGPAGQGQAIAILRRAGA